MSMCDTDWRPGVNSTHPPQSITLYELQNWDGADGRHNQPSGFLTRSRKIANQWNRQGIGRSYRTIQGVIIDNFEQIEAADIERRKQEALNKLTTEEIELLGLNQKEKHNV